MIIIIGLVILIAAVVAGVAGVLSNSGSGHSLTHGFAVLGYHVTGSTGTLFLYGIVIGALALLGLSLLLAGARRTSRRGREARRGLRQSRRETAVVSQHRDDLIGQRDTARAYTAGSLARATAATHKHRRPARPGSPAGRRAAGGTWRSRRSGCARGAPHAHAPAASRTPARVSPPAGAHRSGAAPAPRPAQPGPCHQQHDQPVPGRPARPAVRRRWLRRRPGPPAPRARAAGAGHESATTSARAHLGRPREGHGRRRPHTGSAPDAPAPSLRRPRARSCPAPRSAPR